MVILLVNISPFATSAGPTGRKYGQCSVASWTSAAWTNRRLSTQGRGVGLVTGKVLQMKLWHQLNALELHISRLHGCWHFPWHFLMSSGEALGRMLSILPFHGYHAKISEMPMGFVGSFPTQHNHQPSAFNTKEGCRDGSSTGVARKHGSSTRAARVAWWWYVETAMGWNHQQMLFGTEISGKNGKNKSSGFLGGRFLLVKLNVKSWWFVMYVCFCCFFRPSCQYDFNNATHTCRSTLSYFIQGSMWHV